MNLTYISTRLRKEKYQVNQVPVVINQMSKVERMFLEHFATFLHSIDCN